MPRRRKAPTERIAVTDQVGKRHVVVKYAEQLDGSPPDGETPRRDEVATEYRLLTGRIVERIGADTFQTADGLLRFKVL